MNSEFHKHYLPETRGLDTLKVRAGNHPSAFGSR
jgi:hypothetical protein